jgi:hypothetical protein
MTWLADVTRHDVDTGNAHHVLVIFEHEDD